MLAGLACAGFFGSFGEAVFASPLAAGFFAAASTAASFLPVFDDACFGVDGADGLADLCPAGFVAVVDVLFVGVIGLAAAADDGCAGVAAAGFPAGAFAAGSFGVVFGAAPGPF
ncbi:MAG: hypothetical protein HOQ29_17705 [Acidobacteria bacterium]|nr:hypothetical protein [Acidobacteriota bacterium]